MKDLYPKKELAYIDYHDNAGDVDTGGRLWKEFEVLKDEWNKLCVERKALLKKENK